MDAFLDHVSFLLDPMALVVLGVFGVGLGLLFGGIGLLLGGSP